MDPRLVAHYSRELLHLRETAGEFAAEFPRIAGRLGLDGFECADPYVERLLEGFAFMAARVQTKFDAGYERFTQHLLDTVYPGALAPLPSMLVAQLEPDLRDPALAAGARVPRGSTLRSRIAPDEETACEYRTAHDLALWPLVLREAEYRPRAGDVAALGLSALPLMKPAQAALRLRFDVTAGLRTDQLACDALTLFLRGDGAVPAHLVEQLHGNASGLVVRGHGARGPWQRFLDPASIRAPGFADDEALLPVDARVFSGHRLLQEYFAFPARFQFVEFGGLQSALRLGDATWFEIVVLLDRSDPALDRAVDAGSFALHCTPAINLFPKRADRVLLDGREHEHHLVVDRTRPMDHEVWGVTEVVGHGTNGRRRFTPFHALDGSPADAAHYSLRRAPRQASAAGTRRRTGYLGSEAWLSLVDARERPFESELRELSVETLCTNRDLPLAMPLGGDDDFALLGGGAPLAGIRCVKGPSRPRPPLDAGDAHWRLVHQLALNHASLVGDGDGGGDGRGVAALRDLLSLHADPHDATTARQIDGVRGIVQRAVHRRLPSPGPVCFGRGLQITLTCDDGAFEGSGAFLLGAVLERFFARQASVNAFTETVLRSTTRGDVMRWPARIGRRHAC